MAKKNYQMSESRTRIRRLSVQTKMKPMRAATTEVERLGDELFDMVQDAQGRARGTRNGSGMVIHNGPTLTFVNMGRSPSPLPIAAPPCHNGPTPAQPHTTMTHLSSKPLTSYCNVAKEATYTSPLRLMHGDKNDRDMQPR